MASNPITQPSKGTTMKPNNSTPSNLSRRDWFRVSSLAAAAGLAGVAPSAAAPLPIRGRGPDVYARLGVRPFISCTATTTINGGSSQFPEVVEAIYQAGRYHVNLDELIAKVGPRIAELLQVEAAMVSSGAAGAVTCGTLACLAGGDPEKIQQLPDTTGIKNEVVVPKWSRSIYDHAVRSTGAKMIEVETFDDLEKGFGPKTFMAAAQSSILWGEQPFSLDQLVAAAHRHGVPVLVDDAGGLPVPPHPVLAHGVDLVAHSGGKVIRGPQSAGLLLGRKDLILAAFTNSAPHHAFARAMKVSKEEIVGMLAAVEYLVTKRDPEAEEREWMSWYKHIGDRVSRVAGVSTEIERFEWDRFGYHPRLVIRWNPKKIGLTSAQLHQLLRDGEPRIMVPPGGEGHSAVVRGAAMYSGEYKLVAERLHEVFQDAPKAKPKPKLASPAIDVKGRWDVRLTFSVGSTEHELLLNVEGNELSGVHIGRLTHGDVQGTVSGKEIDFRTAGRYEGTSIGYRFHGTIQTNHMSGEVDLGEYGAAQWEARRA